MGKNILVATSQREIRDFLRVNLEDIEHYWVQYSTSKEEALEFAGQTKFSVMILDTESIDDPSSLVDSIIGHTPHINFILVPPFNNPKHPSINNITPDGYLIRPFFKDDLLDLIERKVNTMNELYEKDESENSNTESNSLLDDLKTQLEDQFNPVQDDVEENEPQSLEDELSTLLSTEFDAPEKLEQENKESPQALEDTAVVNLTDEIDEALKEDADSPKVSFEDGETIKYVLGQPETPTLGEIEEANTDDFEIHSNGSRDFEEELDMLFGEPSPQEAQGLDKGHENLDDLLLQIERQSFEDTGSELDTPQDDWVPEMILAGPELKNEKTQDSLTVSTEGYSETEDSTSELDENEIPESLKPELMEKSKTHSEEGYPIEVSQSEEIESVGQRSDASPQETEITEPMIEEAIKSSILSNDVIGAERELEKLIDRDQITAALITKRNKIWAGAGKLSIKDIHDIESILIQSKSAGKKIDMARFLKLGIEQQKYLLYATTFAGSFDFCTVNDTSTPLSQIRKQTLSIAQKLTFGEESAEETNLESLEPGDEKLTEKNEQPIELVEEAESQHTTLDELLAQQAIGVDLAPADAELEEWVHEVPEEESPLEIMEELPSVEDEPVDDQEPNLPEMQLDQSDSEDLSIKEETIEVEVEVIEEVQAASLGSSNQKFEDPVIEPVEPGTVSVPEIDDGFVGVTDEEPQIPQTEKYTFETEEPMLMENQSTDEVKDLASPPINEPLEEVAQEETAVKTPEFPKAGYGRYKNTKYIKGKERNFSKEQEDLNRKLSLIYKINPSDVSESISDRSHQLSTGGAQIHWEPATEDPLGEIRRKLKNQKQPPKKLLKYSQEEPTAEAQEIKKQTDDDVYSEAEFIQIAPIAPIATDMVLEEIDRVSIETSDFIVPPETLDELSAGEQFGEEDQAVDYQEDIDDILREIMEDLQPEDELPDQELSETAESMEPDNLKSEPVSPTTQAVPSTMQFEEEDIDEDDVVIIDENLDFLKTLAAEMQPGINDRHLDKDATEFFEEYIEEAGEPIEVQESSIAETIPLQSGLEEKRTETESIAEDVIEGIPDDFTQSDSMQDTTEFLELLRETMKEQPDEPPHSYQPPDIEEEFSQNTISRTDEDQPREDVFGAAPWETPPSPSILVDEIIKDETREETIDQFSEEIEDLSKNEVIDSSSDNIDEFPEFDGEDFEEESPTQEIQSEVDLQQIVEEVLAKQTSIEEEKETAVSDIEEDIELYAQDRAKETTDLIDETKAQAEQEETLPTTIDYTPDDDLDTDSIGMEDLLPWEEEDDQAEIDIEVTPTPRSLLEDDQSADVLIDLLAQTRVDPVQLGFDQPIYTCILVPELSGFSLNNKIASRIREWLPKLSRVYGWEFDTVFVQPTYLQWTVRVPSGTSQGSIVRRIRQQTSLRIFEEFPELKKLSQSGNFWAKGYLVVSGSNPPPAEFLDDFIQKNRRPSGIMGS